MLAQVLDQAGADAPPVATARAVDNGDGFWADPAVAFEQVERIGAWEKLISWAQARQMAEMVDLVSRAESCPPPRYSPEQAEESARSEIRLMLTLTAGSTGFRVEDARTLIERFPATHRALERGSITLPKARIISDECAELDPEHAAAAEAAVLPKAPGRTTGQLRAVLRREILRVDPAAAERRHRRKRRERGVTLFPERDGMATLSANLPAAEAVGAYAVLDEHARRCGTHDERSMDARRADVLVDLVLADTGSATTDDPESTEPSSTNATTTPGDPVLATASPDDAAAADCGWVPSEPGTDPDRWPGLAPSGDAPAVRAGTSVTVQVRVTVPYDTLCGRSDEPGELAGYGPIPASQARDLSSRGTWQRLVTDPLSGMLLDYGTTRYRPPEDLAEFIRYRDQVCGHPGCRVPAHRCDLDHTIPYDPENDRGPTSAANMSPKCRPHHQLKQLPDWVVTQDEDATVTWTTPSGHRYTTSPPPLPGKPRTPRSGPRLGRGLGLGQWLGRLDASTPAHPPHLDDPPPF